MLTIIDPANALKRSEQRLLMIVSMLSLTLATTMPRMLRMIVVIAVDCQYHAMELGSACHDVRALWDQVRALALQFQRAASTPAPERLATRHSTQPACSHPPLPVAPLQ